MPQSSNAARPEAQQEESSYPPCLFSSAEEKRLYQRLKDAYMANYSTWGAEACEAWPYIVEHASLAPSTIEKITNHSITRNMTNIKVTWAHVVALRIIYKGRLFKSRKIMRLIRAKYPRANFNSYAYNEEYARPLKMEEEEKRPEKVAQEKNPCVAHDAQDKTDDPRGKVPPTAPQVVNETINRFLNDKENSQPAEETDGPYFTRIKPKPVPIKMEEQSNPVMRENENNLQIVPHSSSKRKRAIPENTDGNGNAEHRDTRKRPTRRQKKDKPCAATHSAPDPPAIQNEVMDIVEVAGGSSSRKKGTQDKSMDQSNEAMGNPGDSLAENTRAVERNTRALENTSKLLEKLTEQLLNYRRKKS